MSVAEFVDWIAFLRQYPAGGRWLNLQFAELKREIAKGRPRARGDRLPTLDHYLWKPPEPLFVTRLREEAKARAAGESIP